MRDLTNILKNMSLVSQFGLSLITPTLLMLGLCWWLTSSFGLGGWVYIPGFFFGLGGSFTVAYKFYRTTMKKEKKQEKSQKVFFNKHS